MPKRLSQIERFRQELRLLQERMHCDPADVLPVEPAAPREAAEGSPRDADARSRPL